MDLKEFIAKTIRDVKEYSPCTHSIAFDLIVSPNRYLKDGEMITVIEVIGSSTNDIRATTIKFTVEC